MATKNKVEVQADRQLKSVKTSWLQKYNARSVVLGLPLSLTSELKD